VNLFSRSRPPASPQKGLMARRETLTGDWRARQIEVVAQNEGSMGSRIGVYLFVDAERVGETAIGRRTTDDDRVIRALVPGDGETIELRIDGGVTGQAYYTLAVAGDAVPLAIRRGGRKV
jgi:hypothetical protein